MEESGVMLRTNHKVVLMYNLNNSFWFTKEKQVVVGKAVSAFVTAEKWLGSGGMDGRRVEIEDSAETTWDCV